MLSNAWRSDTIAATNCASEMAPLMQDNRATARARTIRQRGSHLGRSATATLKLFQQRREMWRDGGVDRIVPGPQPSPDFLQPRGLAQDVARFGSARPTLRALSNSCRLRRPRKCARRLSTKRPLLLRSSVKVQGISRHNALVFTIFFGDWSFSGSSPNARARYMSASWRYRRLSRSDFVTVVRRAHSSALPR
jgi:hypothetical protein